LIFKKKSLFVLLQVTQFLPMCVQQVISVLCQPAHPHPLMLQQVTSVLQAGTVRQVVLLVLAVHREPLVT
jgi:hypothetical protein